MVIGSDNRFIGQGFSPDDAYKACREHYDAIYGDDGWSEPEDCEFFDAFKFTVKSVQSITRG